MNPESVYGSIEAGGTKFICLVGRDPGDVLGHQRIQTSTPDVTLDQAIDFFRPFCDTGQISSIGIGCFGPVELEP